MKLKNLVLLTTLAAAPVVSVVAQTSGQQNPTSGQQTPTSTTQSNPGNTPQSKSPTNGGPTGDGPVTASKEDMEKAREALFVDTNPS